jgi:hypothetical protein
MRKKRKYIKIILKLVAEKKERQEKRNFKV